MAKPLFILLSLWVTYSALVGQELSITSHDGFELSARVWKQNKAAPAILLLHQCDADQSMYTQLAALLYQKGLHVITYDNRGLGLSTNAEFNLKKAKNNREHWDKIISHNQEDQEAIMDFITDDLGVDVNSIGLLGASCGGAKVIDLSAKYKGKVKAIGFLSTRMSAAITAQLKQSQIPALFIAAEADKGAFNTAISGFSFSKSDDSKLIVYKGKAHGYPLFKKDSSLEKTIAEWFSKVMLQ